MYNFNLLESVDTIKSEFSFLISEYGFEIVEESSTNKGVNYHYGNGKVRIDLTYDYRENFFYFKLIRGKNTQYPNDRDFENIKPFFRLTEKYEPTLPPNKLQPDENQYREALKLNAEVLKKYGDKILKGEEWF